MWKKIFLNGIFNENPILIIMIGLCPVLACSSSATDALGMGISATFVLICSNVLISLTRKFTPAEIRIPVFIVIIATFVTLIDFLLQAYFPVLSERLGVFVPLIVVNCIILGRAEAFAYKNGVWESFWDALGMGAGFTFALVLLGCFREFFGAGTIFKSKVILSNPATIMILPPGAFIGIGILISIWKSLRRDKSSFISPCSTCALAQMCHPAEGKCDIMSNLESDREKNELL